MLFLKKLLCLSLLLSISFKCMHAMEQNSEFIEDLGRQTAQSTVTTIPNLSDNPILSQLGISQTLAQQVFLFFDLLTQTKQKDRNNLYSPLLFHLWRYDIDCFKDCMKSIQGLDSDVVLEGDDTINFIWQQIFEARRTEGIYYKSLRESSKSIDENDLLSKNFTKVLNTLEVVLQKNGCLAYPWQPLPPIHKFFFLNAMCFEAKEKKLIAEYRAMQKPSQTPMITAAAQPQVAPPATIHDALT